MADSGTNALSTLLEALVLWLFWATAFILGLQITRYTGRPHPVAKQPARSSRSERLGLLAPF